MRRSLILVIWLLLVASLALSPGFVAAQADDLSAGQSGLLVQIRATPGAEGDLRTNLDRLARAQGMMVARVWPHLNVGLLQPNPGLAGERAADAQTTAARRQALMADPAVVLVEIDAPVYAAVLSPARSFAPLGDVIVQPNDPRLSEQYALGSIDAFGGWGISQGSPAMTVAVIDSGYDLDHEDIDQTSVWVNQAEATGLPGVDDDNNGYVDDINGWDFIEHDGITNDPYGHGTHVGGVIAAATHNGVGVASVGRNLRVLPLRILDRYGSGSISGLLDALDYAVAQNMRVINLSLVTTTDSATLHTAIQAVADQGILVVAAAGNKGASVTGYFPAAWPEVFTVAATDGADNVTLFSNYGAAIDVGAPGSAVLSTYKDNSYYLNSGTSMSTPHVSALAGLLLSLRPDLSLVQLTDLIRTTAQDVNQINYPGRDNYLGDGRINVRAALLAASQGVEMAAGGDNLLPAGGDNLLPAGETGIIQVTVSAGAQPIQGGVMAYALHAEGDSEIVSRGTLLTGPEATSAISVTTPITPGRYTVDLSIGQAAVSLPVYIYAAPLRLSLSTEHELSAQDRSLPFVLRVLDGNGDYLPVPILARLHTTVGLYDNGAPEMEIQVINGHYTGTLHSWSMVDLLNADMIIDAYIHATGQTTRIVVPFRAYRLYFPWVAISNLE